MADNNWFNPNSGQPFDPSTFNYGTQEQKIARARAAANALQSQAVASTPGQLIENKAGTWFAGGNNMATVSAKLIGALLGNQAQSGTDDAQNTLDQNSQAALQYQLDPANSVAGKAAADKQAADEQTSINDHEMSRLVAQQAQAQAGQTVDPSAAAGADPQAAQTSPVSSGGPVSMQDLPVTQAAPSAARATPPQVKAAAQALTKGSPIDFGSGSGNDWSDSAQATPTPPVYDMDGNRISGDEPKSSAPTSSYGSQMANVAKFLFSAPGSPQNPTTPTPQATAAVNALNTPGASPAAPSASATPSPTPVLPPMPQGNGATPPPPGAMPAPQGQPVPQPAPQPNASGMSPQQQQIAAAAQARVAPGQPINNDQSMTQQAAAAAGTDPSMSQKLGQIQAIARTGPMGQQMANGMLQQMFSHADRYDSKLNDNGDGIVTDKWTGQVQRVQGMGNTLKLDEQATNRVKNLDPNNTAAVSNENAWRSQHGLPALTPEIIAGSNMSADQRVSANNTNATAVSNIVKTRTDAQSKVADLGKLSSDLGTAMGLANDAAGKYSGIKGTIASFFGGGAQQQQLERIINDSTLMGIMQDKGGVGSAGSSLYHAYQEHGLQTTMTPEALQQGLTQLKTAVDGRVGAYNGEISGHNYALKALGYQDPQPAQTTQGNAAPNGRAPGTYKF